MAWSRSLICLSLVTALSGTAGGAAVKTTNVGDAYVRNDAGSRWTIGTKSMEMSLQYRDGKLLLVGLKNKLVSPEREYVSSNNAADLLAANAKAPVEKFVIQKLWEKSLLGGKGTVDPSDDGLKIPVKKGEMIGFAIGPHGNYACDQTEWITTVDYGDGTVYTSTDDPKVNQGPVWFYYVNTPNTGLMDEMDSVEWSPNIKEDIRIPSDGSGNRSPGMAPHIGSTVMHPANDLDAVRVWRAPKDGVVTVRGKAKSVGGGDVDLKVLFIKDKPSIKQAEVLPGWTLESSTGRKVVEGGRPAVELDLVLKRGDVRMRYFVMAYPGSSVMRQWSVIENLGGAAMALKPYSNVFAVDLNGKDAESYTHYWLNNLGENPDTQWKMPSAKVTSSYHQSVGSTATIQRIPWTALFENDKPNAGLFVTLDYMGDWKLKLDHDGDGPMQLAGVTDFRGEMLDPKEQFQTPYVAIGVFHKDLDDMARRVYDWQYTYLWDYTHDDWFGRMQFTAAWWGTGKNLNEQFTGRLANLDMNWSEYVRTLGMGVLWDDAGWAANRDIWAGNREGPDYAQTVRFMPKMDMKWCLWFPGDPTSGIMDTKVGSWGNFQWRTDGLPLGGDLDRTFRGEVTGFLKKHPRSSWQTCTGGGLYAHTFEWQRFGDIHYDTDPPGNGVTNAYLSYLEVPDKWFDNLCTWSDDVGNPYKVRRMLSECPKWGDYITPEQMEQMAPIADIYHYLTQEGVAGRWSYMAHPVIKGDDEFNYAQRISYDRKKSIIIIKHKAPGDVMIYPRELVARAKYLVEWDSGKSSATRTGKDLMENGILLHEQAPYELIYLNLPNRPNSSKDKIAPTQPGKVYTRREMNLGFTGVGVYWSPGADNNWISFYEVRRGGVILGKTATGTYYFDRSAGWDPKAAYSVRTVDGDGNKSEWTNAEPAVDETLAYSALGGHYSEEWRNGWGGETSSDGIAYQMMKWVPAAHPPSADFGGTADQVGGGEGYWEAAGTARVGRGWQSASKDAMSIRSWHAARAGTIKVTGQAVKEYYHNGQGEPLRIRILRETTKVWPTDGDWATVPVNDLSGVSHDLTLKVATGETIRFVLDKGNSPENDILGWMPMISYVDEKPQVRPQSVVRILCGSKAAYTDSQGRKWSGDKYFIGGKPMASSVKISCATPADKDQALYRNGRTGTQFTYSIPVKPGIYAIRLKFAEPEYSYFFQRPFNLDINGRRVMSNVDICQAARAPRKAYERVFRYLVPNANGKFVLKFTGGWEPMAESKEAMVQAIEVLPEAKPSVRVDCGSKSEFIDWAGWVWSADTGCTGGSCIESDAAVDQASPTLYDQALYRTARTGKTIGYSFELPDGLYTVHLKFAEMWLKSIGQRPMNIQINGKTYWKGFDPSKTAGKLGSTADIRAEDITPDKNGKITIKVSAAGANDAILQGIEIE